ncbi:MAG: TRAP transporter large permease [Dehalococcoidales bacterium]|nr:TRAP transporter large permease [Dehalococcoidales bacterium]
MNEPLIGLIGIVLLVVLMFLKVPVAYLMMLVGFAGLVVLIGFGPALTQIGLIPHRYVADYSIAVLPLFLLMGMLVSAAGISRDLFKTAYAWFGQIRGGLAMATVVACAGFAAACGSSMAEAAAMGEVVVPEMRKYKYDPGMTIGSIAAGGTLAILIPPSLGFILYAMLTAQSIGRLFMAGILPGITVVVFYLTTIYILCKRNPSLGPAAFKTSFKEKVTTLRGSGAMLILFVVVMGGIYGGIFTTTEAGAVGAFGALVIGLILRRYSRQSLWGALAETGKLTGMMLAIFVGAMIFNSFLALSQLPFWLAEAVANLNMPTFVILVVILLIYILLGCFFDVITVLVLTIPIFFPVIQTLGIDPIWYGVLMVRVNEVGLITPPFGMNNFILAGVTKVPLGTIYRGIIPFVIADMFNIALLLALPQISLLLPNMMMGK